MAGGEHQVRRDQECVGPFGNWPDRGPLPVKRTNAIRHLTGSNEAGFLNFRCLNAAFFLHSPQSQRASCFDAKFATHGQKRFIIWYTQI
jgi:hypothetical protein